MRGILLYNREDFYKNKWFAERIVDNAKQLDMEIKVILTDEINLIIDSDKLLVTHRGEELLKPDFVINRSRDSVIGYHFQIIGSTVFNSPQITEVCNNKARTHQIVNSHGIPSVKTLICNRKYFSPSYVELKFPIVIKSSSGHGGLEVYKVDCMNELLDKISILSEDGFILQELCSNPGKDIRVYVIGKEVIASVIRYSIEDFRANISLGGNSSVYNLSEKDLEIVNKIINIFNFDFVGIDFILDSNNNLLFNEIEDVVGTRALYKHYNFDITKKFLEYIKNELTKRKTNNK
ncbi:ATP-grasp domain-containing protein [Caldicellulosiruptor acetigenus]|uniref:Alpha-L-glutamate ligase, RimK family n=1 Tax=Caldicellulosiruptor acetigenus 6A TaxID=632516 RepID=G2PUC0_9FIRM|nr:RimK family alpha-L-glutamate ligase [Caldicellulosiruptor acetigenus]AEM73512.1 alpha-L-glutamate ligase, RimK family [Caldicellulosiruptor acetigenus 6A]